MVVAFNISLITFNFIAFFFAKMPKFQLNQQQLNLNINILL